MRALMYARVCREYRCGRLEQAGRVPHDGDSPRRVALVSIARAFVMRMGVCAAIVHTGRMVEHEGKGGALMRTQPEREAGERRGTPHAANGGLVVGGGVWRWLVVALFALHGLVHLMGFNAVWGPSESGIASVPTFPAGLTAGSPVVLALGVLWLVAMAAFLAAAAGLILRASWWKGMAAGAAALSLLLCAAWWNDAPIGVIINVAILAGLAIQTWATRARQPGGSLT